MNQSKKGPASDGSGQSAMGESSKTDDERPRPVATIMNGGPVTNEER